MSSPSSVRRHFDEDSARFDRIYADRKSFYQRFIDAKIRGVVVERLRLARALGPFPGEWRFLDVGCGSGRYEIALVREGAARGVGIDFAPRMIELARSAAERAGVADRCEFHVAEFLDFAAPQPFELVLAMGYFDYIADPRPHLSKMKELCSGRLLASFPKRWEWRVPMRRLRFALAGGYVRFFGREEVTRLADAVGLLPERRYILDFGRDYVLIARP